MRDGWKGGKSAPHSCLSTGRRIDKPIFPSYGSFITRFQLGPWLLVSAGLVRGRHMTSYHTIQDDIRNAGGLWEDSEVVRDRNWVSSRSPKDLPAFNREMIALFSEYWNKAGKRHAA